MHRFPVLFPVVFLFMFIAGCNESPVEPYFDDDAQRYVIEKNFDGLEQKLFLSSLTPAYGDTLEIRSVVINTGDAREVESRICGLNIESKLVLQHAGPFCDGYSQLGLLETGESRETWEAGIVTSSPGTYRLQIQHLLDPESYVTVEIEVII